MHRKNTISIYLSVHKILLKKVCFLRSHDRWRTNFCVIYNKKHEFYRWKAKKKSDLHCNWWGANVWHYLPKDRSRTVFWCIFDVVYQSPIAVENEAFCKELNVKFNFCVQKDRWGSFFAHVLFFVVQSSIAVENNGFLRPLLSFFL